MTTGLRRAVWFLVGAFGAVGCRSEEPRKGAARDEPVATAASASTTPARGASIHGLTMNRLDGTPAALSSFRGTVLLVVNTASECGYTPQYEGLQKLHQTFSARGFSVLGFPSNDFGEQEPGSSSEIANFCKSKFGVTFPLFEKVKTTGAGRADLYTLLTEAKGPPKWNFHKYLVDKDGFVVRAWPSSVAPESPELSAAIEAELTKH